MKIEIPFTHWIRFYSLALSTLCFLYKRGVNYWIIDAEFILDKSEKLIKVLLLLLVKLSLFGKLLGPFFCFKSLLSQNFLGY